LAADLEIDEGSGFEELGHEVLDDFALKVGEKSVGVPVGFDKAAGFAVGAEVPMISYGAFFLASAGGHGLSGFLEGVKFPFINGQGDVEVNLVAHEFASGAGFARDVSGNLPRRDDAKVRVFRGMPQRWSQVSVIEEIGIG
jgi:hypothetical protein